MSTSVHVLHKLILVIYSWVFYASTYGEIKYEVIKYLHPFLVKEIVKSKNLKVISAPKLSLHRKSLQLSPQIPIYRTYIVIKRCLFKGRLIYTRGLTSAKSIFYGKHFFTHTHTQNCRRECAFPVTLCCFDLSLAHIPFPSRFSDAFW